MERKKINLEAIRKMIGPDKLSPIKAAKIQCGASKQKCKCKCKCIRKQEEEKIDIDL